jgi:hypothetical protein
LGANDGNDRIRETALRELGGCHEVLESFHVELAISINQLHAFLHFHYRSNSRTTAFDVPSLPD